MEVPYFLLFLLINSFTIEASHGIKYRGRQAHNKCKVSLRILIVTKNPHLAFIILFILEFFFAKIELTKVEVLDYFGPLSNVSIDDYLKAKI